MGCWPKRVPTARVHAVCSTQTVEALMTRRGLPTVGGLVGAWLVATCPVVGISVRKSAAAAPAPAASPAAGAKERSKRRRPAAGRQQAGTANKPGATGPAKQQAAAGGEAKPADANSGKSGPPPIVRSDHPDKGPPSQPVPLKPDAHGRMTFQFRGQKWPAVLEWLADWSHMSLDWQELPGDYLNLTTRRKYTAREARDLINRHLLARGYTMLVQGESLSVVNIKKLDPAMVPRVAPDQLDDRDPHEFVKVSFRLDWLLASRAAEELKPMLSPNGKLTALTTTNRLEAIDSVADLRQIAGVLRDEQSGEGQQHLVRKFVLHHTRASEVREQLMTLLGIEAKRPAQPMTPQQMQQQMQMAQMRAQQKKKGSSPAKKKSPVYLVAVPRENVILANAPPDKMALIEAAIRAIDVEVDRGSAYRRSVERMNIYHLTTIDPAALVKTLEEIGNLDFNTRLEVDKQNRAIIAYASLADHLTIRSLIEKLDGSARDFHVIQLRRLEAEYVAGTIQFMMGGKEEKQPRQRRRYYSFFEPARQSRESTPQDQFSVDADIANNRLLLRANEDEIRQVEDLLIKLGEIPSRTGDPSTVRLIEAPQGPSAEAWLERIRRTWNGPNRLEIDLPEEDPAEAKPQPNARGTRPPVRPPKDTTTGWQPADAHRVLDRAGWHVAVHAAAPTGRWRFVQLQSPAKEDHGTGAGRGGPNVGRRSPDRSAPLAEKPAEKHAGPPPPIKISRAPDGRLMITCKDPRALDRLEDLIIEFPPPHKDYELFQLKYASAWLVTLNLEDYFKDETKKDDSRQHRFWFYGYNGGDEEKQGLSRLSRRRPVKFIYDTDTNSIVVQNANPRQLDTIRKLIDFYDQPEPPNSQSVRKMQVIKLKYSRAEVVAEAVKDVFIDLLSSNDKARQKSSNGKQDKTVERVYYDYYDSNDSQGQKQMLPKFKGLLSLGIDQLSNSLVVSAPEFVMVPVVHMIEELDASARPTSAVEVVRVGRGVNPARLQQMLSTMMGETSSTAKRNGAKKPAASGGKRQGGRQQGANRAAAAHSP